MRQYLQYIKNSFLKSKNRLKTIEKSHYAVDNF